MKLDEFTVRRARKALKRRLAELRETFVAVRIVDDGLVVMNVELDNGEGDRMAMTLDPLGLFDKLHKERALGQSC